VRIGMNLLYLIPGHVGGTQTYAESLIRALAGIDERNQYTLFVNPEAARLDWPQKPNFHIVVCRLAARRRAARYAYEQLVLPRLLKQLNIDLVHSPGYVSPLKTHCASVVSILDVVHVAYPMSRAKRLALGFFVTQSARRCDHIITISRFSQQKIREHLGVAAEKTTVTPLGFRESPPLAPTDFASLSTRYNIEKPYIVAFSGLPVHKNMPRLIQAFARLAAEIDHQLVLIGNLPPGSDVRGEIARHGLEKRVVITGYVPDRDVMPLLQHGDVFVFPSWYEGFGLPVLDAQRAGLPIACSRAASLPEVAGDAAQYFDPFSVQEMTESIRRCAQDDSLRARLRERGQENARRFSWKNTARATLEVYHEVVKRRE